MNRIRTNAENDLMKKQEESGQVRGLVSMPGLIRLVCTGVLLLGSCMYFIAGETMMPVRFAAGNGFVFLFLLFGLLLLAVNLFYFAWQILLAGRYKTFDDPGDEALPTCAVVVPAFNEGRQVSLALESLLKCDYPADKLEIIAVNDGSRDDTWYWMKKTADESGGRIRAVNLPRNGGKRRALMAGFLTTKAEVLVTFDSDSVAVPDTIRAIAAPFVADPTVGATAGNVRVLNREAGMIPKMLDVSFVFGFEFLRSAQSMVRSVLCTPGALSAYRRSAVLPFLNEWVNEKFMGRPSNIGEDRAITNILLREGWGVVFQRSAVVYTEMPLTYGTLCRMLIRWGRSNVRENITMSKFAFKRFDLQDDDLTGMQINLIVQFFWMLAPVVFTVYSVFCFLGDAIPFICGAAFAIVFWATMPAFIYARRRHNAADSLWSYVYGIYSFLTLFWISPYCVFTVRRSGWLTRQTPKTGEEKVLTGNGSVPAAGDLPKVSHG